MFDCSGTYGDSDANIHLFLEFESLLMKLSEYSETECALLKHNKNKCEKI